jgi:hypothetical protein
LTALLLDDAGSRLKIWYPKTSGSGLALHETVTLRSPFARAVTFRGGAGCTPTLKLVPAVEERKAQLLSTLHSVPLTSAETP